MIPASIVRAVAAAPQSEARDTLLAAWGYSPDLVPVSDAKRELALSNLGRIIHDGN